MTKKIISDKPNEVMRARTPFELEFLLAYRALPENKKQRMRRFIHAMHNGQIDTAKVMQMTDEERMAFVEALPRVSSKRLLTTLKEPSHAN